MKIFDTRLKTGIFYRELKNRFLCIVKFNNNEIVCYVPTSCHVCRFINLQNKEVILRPNANPTAKTKFAVFAVKYKRNYIILDTSQANRAIEMSLKLRKFDYLGKRKIVRREYTIQDYKCDLYIEDTDTLIEVKSLISLENTALFPSMYSERMNAQLDKIKILLEEGHNAIFYIVSLHPYLHSVEINKETEFYQKLCACIELGMKVKAYTTRFNGRELLIDKRIPVITFDAKLK